MQTAFGGGRGIQELLTNQPAMSIASALVARVKAPSRWAVGKASPDRPFHEPSEFFYLEEEDIVSVSKLAGTLRNRTMVGAGWKTLSRESG